MAKDAWEREAEWERVLVQLDKDLIAWLDEEARKRERSRSWLVNHLARMYRRQLEGARRRAARRKERG